MVGPWPHRAFTFRALSKTYGQMWLRCDVCRRYARLKLAGLHDVDYRTKTFSCSVCGSEAYFCLVEPITEYGMADYRLDERETEASSALRSCRGARCGGLSVWPIRGNPSERWCHIYQRDVMAPEPVSLSCFKAPTDLTVDVPVGQGRSGRTKSPAGLRLRTGRTR